jgi:hypothetical protein
MKKVILYYFLLQAGFISAQKNIITVGIQYKPVFTVDFLNSGNETVSQNGVNFSVGLHSGFAAGMIIRRGITDRYSIEGGINYIKRTYSLKISDGNFSGESTFGIIGYEIPLSGLVYIQLSDKFYMNASLGVSMDMFPSDVTTSDYYFATYSARNHVFNVGVLGNLGWELRTEKAGYFYIGASYHNPFSGILRTGIFYDYNSKKEDTVISLTGTYLTIDLRYFFHEDPIKKSKNPEKDEE